MTDVRVLLVTVPDEAAAERIARVLLDERLVACANVVPGLRSLYHWQNQVCDDREVLLILKTVRAHVATLVDRVTEVHPYEVPEVLALPVDDGAAPYLSWVRQETRRGEAK